MSVFLYIYTYIRRLYSLCVHACATYYVCVSAHKYVQIQRLAQSPKGASTVIVFMKWSPTHFSQWPH